jgi:hypothetical protein
LQAAIAVAISNRHFPFTNSADASTAKTSSFQPNDTGIWSHRRHWDGSGRCSAHQATAYYIIQQEQPTSSISGLVQEHAAAGIPRGHRTGFSVAYAVSFHIV